MSGSCYYFMPLFIGRFSEWRLYCMLVATSYANLMIRVTDAEVFISDLNVLTIVLSFIVYSIIAVITYTRHLRCVEILNHH